MTTLANLTTYISGESGSFLQTIEKTRGGLRSLINSLDPVAAATAKYNRQVGQLEKGLQSGALTIEAHSRLLDRLRTRYEQSTRSQQTLTAASGSARAGMQQLSYQLGDISTMFAMGAKPTQIFASQIGQVTQAIQLMSGNSKGFVGFLAGPWGMALSAAVVALTPLISSLLSASDAAKELEKKLKEAASGADAISDAQSSLGRVIDLTTGKFKTQNQVLISAIRLQAMLSQIQAREGQAAAAREIRGYADRRTGGFAINTPGGTGMGPASRSQRQFPGVAAIARTFQAQVAGSGPDAPGQAIENARKGLEGLRKEGKLTERQFLDLYGSFQKFSNEQLRMNVAAGELGALDGKGLPAELREEATKRKGREKADRSAEEALRNQRAYEDDLDRLVVQQLQMQSRLSLTTEERADYDRQLLDVEKQAYEQAVARRVKDNELTAQQAKRLLAGNAYNINLERDRIDAEEADALNRERLSVRREAIGIEIELLRGTLADARTATERAAIERQILAHRYELERLALKEVEQAQLASPVAKENARRALAALPSRQASDDRAITKANLGPLAESLDRMPRSAAELSEAYQRVAVDGLGSLTDGLAEAIAGTRSLADAFGQMANQIIADLARIAIQKAITNAIGGALGDLFGGSDPIKLLAKGNGITSADAIALPGYATGGSMMVGGLAGTDKNVLSLNGIPQARVSRGERIDVVPSNRSGAGAGMTFDLRGAVMTQDLLVQMNQMAVTSGGALIRDNNSRQARAAGRRMGR